MFRLRRARYTNSASLLDSRLLDQDTFYKVFVDDLKKANSHVVIESPFITTKRMAMLYPVLQALRKRGVRLVVNTKPLDEHDTEYRQQTERAIIELQKLGVTVLFTGGHHRKLAIIDEGILYEGSLNILSQNANCEIMRRVTSRDLAVQMLHFTKLDRFLDK